MNNNLPIAMNPYSFQNNFQQKHTALFTEAPAQNTQYSLISPKAFQQFERPKTPPGKMNVSQDLFRETPLRYAGYLNEVGEAFHGVISESTLKTSYRLTALYALSDAFDKGIKAYRQNRESSTLEKAKDGMQNALEAGLFQYLASYLIPAQIIKNVVSILNKLLNQVFPSANPYIKKWTGSLAGLSLIPLIVKPIDHFCQSAIDHFIHPTLNKAFNSLN